MPHGSDDDTAADDARARSSESEWPGHWQACPGQSRHSVPRFQSRPINGLGFQRWFDSEARIRVGPGPHHRSGAAAAAAATAAFASIAPGDGGRPEFTVRRAASDGAAATVAVVAGLDESNARAIDGDGLGGGGAAESSPAAIAAQVAAASDRRLI